MDDAVGYLLELRTRVRRNAYAVSVIDRCLQLIARAANADAVGRLALEREVETLREELETRFGPARLRSLH